jgi:hypothetical protein
MEVKKPSNRQARDPGYPISFIIDPGMAAPVPPGLSTMDVITSAVGWEANRGDAAAKVRWMMG